MSWSDRFGLEQYIDDLPESLPLGVRQRLSLAVAVIHDPEMLILDEPTSGVDPVARDEFWELLIDMSRQKQVTIFISTHFMNEAMRCDRISLMHAGVVLACDTPSALVAARGSASLEEAFIAYIADATGEAKAGSARTPASREEAAALAPAGPRARHPAAGVALGPRPAPGLQPPRDARDPPRPGAACLRVRRLAGPHAGLRFRDHHGRREHPLRLPGPRPDAREPGLPRRVRRLPLLSAAAAACTARKKPNGGCGPTRSRWRSRFRPSSAATSSARRPRGLRRGRRREPVPGRVDQAVRRRRECQLHRPPRRVHVVRRPRAARSDHDPVRATATTRASRASTRSCRASRPSS